MTEACPICGEPVDEDEGHDPHGHFDTTNVPCTICGELPEDHGVPDDHFLAGKVKERADHEYESGV